MRVYLLLILFFASTVLARARIKRDTNVTTIVPPATSTTNPGNATDTGNICSGCKDFNPLKIISRFVKPILVAIENGLSTILKAIDAMGEFALRVTMQPIVVILHIMIKFIKSLLSVFTSLAL